MNRRAFFGAAAAAPVAVQAAGRGFINTLQDGRIGIGVAEQAYNATQAKLAAMPTRSMVQRVLASTEMRREIMSRLFAEHQRVDSIDPDLHVLRAMSPMAKVTFQRQRNVERRLEQMTAGITGDSMTETAWSLMYSYLNK